jgi:arsenite methyltransferase
MSPLLDFDDTLSRRIEATYLTPDIVEQRHAALAALHLQPGEDVLDVGAGPGLLAAEMADAVGPGGSVRGIDSSESMLALARGRSLPETAAEIEFRVGDACALPYHDRSVDVVTSTQVYEYVENVPVALAEAYRVLRPGGRLLVLDTDWDSIVWHASDPDRMARVLRAWDDHLVDPHLPRKLTALLTTAGFAVTHRAVIPILDAGYDTNTYSAGLIGFITPFVPGHNGVTEADTTAWVNDLTGLGPDYFFSINRYLFLAVKQPP